MLWLQKSVLIQKRTSPLEFAHLAEKSENGSISNLSTKVCHPCRARLRPRGGLPQGCAQDSWGKEAWGKPRLRKSLNRAQPSQPVLRSTAGRRTEILKICAQLVVTRANKKEYWNILNKKWKKKNRRMKKGNSRFLKSLKSEEVSKNLLKPCSPRT